MRALYEIGRASRNKERFVELLNRLDAGDPNIFFSGYTPPDYSVDIDLTSSLTSMTFEELQILRSELCDVANDLMKRQPEPCRVIAYDAWEESLGEINTRIAEVDLVISGNWEDEA